MKPAVLRGLLVTGALAAWEAGSRGTLVGRLFFPPPSAIATAAVRMTIAGTLPAHLAATVARVLAGFLIGTVPAVAVGAWLGLSRRARQVLDPILGAAHAIPKIALFPLLLLVVGLGEPPLVALVAVSSFFPLAINTSEGVRQIDRSYLEVARSFSASRVKTLARVVFPGSLPMILTGMRLALTVALMLTIAAEILAARKGLGCLIWNAWQTFRPDELFVGVIASAAVGILIRYAFERSMRRFAAWREDPA
jgi:ABC-type nitrate/sulfonate/bicarbonate transport system permease component